MVKVTYLCYKCRKPNVWRFKNGYRPFFRWLVTCQKCRKYHMQRVVEVNSYTQLAPQADPFFR